MPIVLLAGLVATEPAPVGQAYRWLVFAGLLCSLGGDVWLLFPRGFVAGLASFLLAHLLYIAAFAPGTPWNASAWALLAPFGLVSLVVLRHLWPHLGRERAPVAAYVSVIAVMGWRAAVRVTAAPAASGGLALAGALLFMLSDGLLATDRFARRLAAPAERAREEERLIEAADAEPGAVEGNGDEERVGSERIPFGEQRAERAGQRSPAAIL